MDMDRYVEILLAVFLTLLVGTMVLVCIIVIYKTLNLG